jgi:hypothetical protein
VAEDLDWGPKRPPAVGWAGALLSLIALGQLGALVAALATNSEALFSSDAERIVTGSAMGLFALQLLAGIGVLRLWRWWRGVAMVLCFLGLAVQVVNLGPPPDRVVVVVINVALAGLYAIVLLLLARSRSAFR